MKEIKVWRKATEDLTRAFVKKYFPDAVYDEDSWWVADRVGYAFCIGDYYFDVDRMIEALELKASAKKLFAYYNLELECGMQERPVGVNFQNYVKYGLIGGRENNVE